MAKRKIKTKPTFKLTRKASANLDRYFLAIKKGILNVCEMHTHDSNPSLSQEDFELAYIDKTLGKTCSAVSLSQKAIVEGLAAQKAAEAGSALAAPVENNKTTKKEDN